MVKRPSIDHVTAVVGDLEAASSALRTLLRCTPVGDVRMASMGVRTFRLGESELHLATPRGRGPVEDFYRTRGGGFHHLALKFDELDAALSWLRTLGVRTLGDPVETAPGLREVFFDPASTAGMLIQAVERRRSETVSPGDLDAEALAVLLRQGTGGGSGVQG